MPNNKSLVNRLKSQFDTNPTLKEKCLQSSHAAIVNQTANRVFDDFPALVAEEDNLSLLEEYQRLLICGTKNSVRALEKRLIGIACNELLDSHGNIKQELITLLDWQDHADNINNYLIVSAFVGMMNIYLTSESSAQVADHQYSYLAMTKLINHSYGKWIREYMDEHNIPYDSKYNTTSFSFNDCHPLFFVSLFGGILGVGAYAAIKIGQELYNEHKPLTLPEAPTL